jgi:hypothetical protein
MRIVPARAGALVLFSPAPAVRPKALADQAGIKVHMIFAEEGLIERMDVEGRNPERMRNA